MAADPIALRQEEENDAEARTVIQIEGPNGTVVELIPANIDAKQTNEVKRATGGRSVRKILASFRLDDPDESEVDLDEIAVLWWIARVQSGEEVPLVDVLAEVTYASMPKLAGRGEEEVDDPPRPGSEPSPGEPPRGSLSATA